MEKFKLPPKYDTEQFKKFTDNFPQFFIEGYFDFDAFKSYISDISTIESQEKYSFTWNGKSKSYNNLKKNSRGTLLPCKEESVNWDKTKNLYLEGDNLEVLKLIKNTYSGEKGIKMIYIDPPYNSTEDFIYDDNFVDPLDNYLDYTQQKRIAVPETSGRYHTRWLNLMYPRLWLASYILHDDGIIFISIDDREVHNLRKICDEVFGQDNFIGDIYWESKTKSQNTTTAFDKLQPKIEHILSYTKSNKKKFNLIKKFDKEYPFDDVNGKYREHILELMNSTGIRGRETMIFDISDGVNTISPPEGKQWKIGNNEITKYKERGDLFIRENKVILKIRVEDERNETTEPFWGFFSKTIGTAESAKKELSEIIENHNFETVKPVELIKRLIFHSTDKNDTILDFFSGSATTAHAVMKLNFEDGGNRKFIMVQIPEPISNITYSNIGNCQVKD